MTDTDQQLDAAPKEEHRTHLTVESAIMAFFSALIFGGLGALAGRFLGSKGGEQGPRKLGKDFWTWMGGISSALVAAYTSLKNYASHAPEREALDKSFYEPAQAPTAKSETVPTQPVEPELKKPEAPPEPEKKVAETAHLGAVKPAEKLAEQAI